MAEQALLENDPTQAVKVRRLKEMASRIYTVMDEVDDGIEYWAKSQFPQAYALGVQGQLGEMVWTNLHQEATQRLAQDLFNDLLEATKGVRESTKGLIRNIARDEALQSTIAGGTAQQAGRAMRDKLAAEGIHAVQYVDGSRHSLTEYSEMAMRTKTAEAYNGGTLNAHPETKYWEVFDGPTCGLSFHDDPTLASGLILERGDCEKYLISHPNCRRAFGPRPDIQSQAQIDELAKNPLTVGSGQTTVGQRAAQVEQDTARKAKQSRVAQRKAKLEQRKAQRSNPTPDGAPGGANPSLFAGRDPLLSLPGEAPKVPLTPKDLEFHSDLSPKSVTKTFRTQGEVPSVTDLVDIGFDPEAAVAEQKRLITNARNVERRARNKAKKEAALTGTAETPPVVSPLTSTDPVELDGALAPGSQPKALYSGGKGPGGGYSPWYDRLIGDTAPGEYVPVDHLRIEDYTVKRGVSVRRDGVSYLIETTGLDDAAALAELEKHVETVQKTLAGVPLESQRRAQRGLAVLKGQNPADAHWAVKFDKPGFKSAATGGGGGTTFWGTEPRPGLILHEYGHNLDNLLAAGTPQRYFSKINGWDDLASNDQVSSTFFSNAGFQGSIPGHAVSPGTPGVTSYGALNRQEDFAESVRLYLADQHNGYLGYAIDGGQQVSVRFADVFPERSLELDRIFGKPPGGLPSFSSKQLDKARVELIDGFAKSHAGTFPSTVDLAQKTGLSRRQLQGLTQNQSIIEQAKTARAAHFESLAKQAAAAAEEAKKAEALSHLKNGKLTTEGLSFADKTGVGVKKANAKKKALAAGKTEQEALELSLLAEQEAIAGKLGLDYAEIQKAIPHTPEATVTVADLTSGDKVGIGVKKANAYKKALAEAKTGNVDLSEFQPRIRTFSDEEYDNVAKKYAAAQAAKVEANEIEIRLARIRAERGALGAGVPTGERGVMRPEFVSRHRTRANSFLTQAGKLDSSIGIDYAGPAQRAKDTIAKELSKRLDNESDWPAFQRYLKHRTSVELAPYNAYTEQERAAELYKAASNLVQGWASSSGDSQKWPLVMQQAIKDEFGLESPVFVRGVADATKAEVQAGYAEGGDFMRRFARVQYEHTQEELAKAGITEVSVYRGMRFQTDRPAWAQAGEHRPELQPANSWSTSDSISLRFGSTFFTATVPANQVLGSARTGFGCLNEREFVIFDSPGTARVTPSYRKGSIK